MYIKYVYIAILGRRISSMWNKKREYVWKTNRSYLLCFHLVLSIFCYIIYFFFFLFLQKRLQQRATTKEKGTYRKEGTRPRPSKSDKPKAWHSRLVLKRKQTRKEGWNWFPRKQSLQGQAKACKGINTLVSFFEDVRNHKIYARQKPFTIKPYVS